ncbi:DUF6923 family protein [Amnibacterium flavum]|uniref:DUF6923 family protein n=1 Tax=Amnibacterium flavum TaxID=2173173 RepID=UPI0010581A32|nr:hypothetical protein [Amnibacterium flavum]
MRRTRTSAALIAGLSIAAIALSASPAYAADGRTLPAGDALYAVDCEDTPNQLYSVDSVTAQATPIGSGAELADSTCAGPGAYDRVSGLAYYIDWNDVGSLRSIDVTTGVSTAIGELSIDGVNVFPDSIAIGTDGMAYAIIQDTFEDGDSGIFSVSGLYALDLTTGDLTPIDATGDPGVDYYGFSVDPTTGLFYVIDTEGNIASIDVATGIQTALGTVDFDGDNSTWTLSIDSSGIMWVENDGFDADLWSVDPSDIGGADSFSGIIALDAANAEATSFYTESVFIGPAAVVPAPPVPAVVVPAAVDPALAETGVDAALMGTLGASAGLALLLGGALVIAGRMRRRARA